jgi:pilus assembly protein CpaE
MLVLRLLADRGRSAHSVHALHEAREHSDYGADRCFVFVPDTSGDPALAAEVLRFAEAESRRAFVIYVADAMSADAYKRLIRTGAGEWMTWKTVGSEIGEVLSRAGTAEPEPPVVGATIVSFLPSKGGVGNTTLALETGIHLASGKKRSNARVAVLDLNFQSSTLADYLDLEPRFDIVEIMDRPERLDSQLIDIFSSKHSSNVDIFSSPSRLGTSQNIRGEVIFALLDEVCRKYSFVLLDLPNQWHPWMDNVLLGSSAIAVTGEATVPSLRQIVNKQKYLDDLSIERDRAATIVNACDTNFLGRISRKSEIDRTLAGRQIFYVRRDTASAMEAANTGRPMMQAARNRPISKNIRRVGDWIQSIAASGAGS